MPKATVQQVATPTPGAEFDRRKSERADLVVDQLYSDVPCAGLATEAAALGRPAVVGGYAGEELARWYPADRRPPTEYTHPDGLEAAIEDFNRAIRLNPDDPASYNNCGNAYFKQGDYLRAIEDYNQALRLDANNPATFKNRGLAYNNLGNALARKGKLDEAISHYSRALELKANYPEAHNNLGVALAKQEKLREAIVHFKKALQLRPDYAQARSNLDNAIALLAKTTETPDWSSTGGK